MKLLKTFGGGVMAMLLTGCLAGQGASGGAEGLQVEVLPTSPVKVSSYFLRGEDGTLVVSGRVTSLHLLRIHGHVDIAVTSPGKEPVHYKAEVFAYGSRRGGRMEGQFSATIVPAPASGSAIALRYINPGQEEERP